ncbi:serine/threonine dehydratase [Actinospica robiniae]|uniref:Threonine dehydratase n=1 Tax=Actinospica robiniae DSM 44927 TaxID=479430 RepID=W9E4W8_9ACTN|nr:serine/threonine dehydratase [Actinospica robiniae]ETA71011.1 threonine dehydratase [Actinospica robiniae DSM 44927]
MADRSTAPSLIGPADVAAAADRVSGRIRPVTLAPADPGSSGTEGAHVTFALEYLQHTGSFKARGAANLAAAHQQAGTLPEVGVAIASGGNAGLACAWAARATGTRATVFVPLSAPAVKVEKLRGYGADVHQVGSEYADALAASRTFAAASGALLSHAYDNPLIAAGAGTLAAEILAASPRKVDTIVVAVGGGGLFAGVAAAVSGTGIRTVAVEPENCRALNAALAAAGPVDVAVESVAADALGARRTSQMAYELARGEHVSSVLVPDAAIVEARRHLWETYRITVEPGGATAWAALRSGSYKPEEGEHVVAVLCGANTDPADLVNR